MAAPEFMVGTASWTDKTLIDTTDFYPPDVKTAEDRLRFYAAQFNSVEVDSTYYAIPAERNAEQASLASGSSSSSSRLAGG